MRTEALRNRRILCENRVLRRLDIGENVCISLRFAPLSAGPRGLLSENPTWERKRDLRRFAHAR